MVQLSNHLLKKILAMPEFLRMSEETSGLWRDEELLYETLSSSHLKHFFDRFIDFESYGKDDFGFLSNYAKRSSLFLIFCRKGYQVHTTKAVPSETENGRLPRTSESSDLTTAD